MRIAVGFKVTPDYDALRPADWVRLAAARSAAERAQASRYVRRSFGVFDEAALELALRLRDARSERGLETSLAAFTVAGLEAAPFLATLQALGFEAAHVDPGAAGEDGRLDFAPVTTAALVAACARWLGGDVLLLGARGSPGGSGTVPFLAAESLGRPCLTDVTAIGPADGDGLRVTWTQDDGPARSTVGTSCVLAIGNAVVSLLRVPTLKERLAARDAPVQPLSPAALGVDVAAALAREPATIAAVATVDRRRSGAIVTGATPREKARALCDGHLRARLEQL